MTSGEQQGEATSGFTLAAHSTCSRRSKRLLTPAMSYLSAFFTAIADQWHPKSNPDGWIPLAVAENRVGGPAFLERLEAASIGAPPAVLNYANMKGIPELQGAVARLLERTFLPGHAVDTGDLCISAGCSAIIDNLFYCLADEGAGVLIPAPYYPAFDNDLQAKCCLHPLPFFVSEEAAADGLSIRQQLDAAVEDAAGFGVPVKALLVTNPNNPLGTLYREETVSEMLAWCLDKRVHYVSDEIYALSMYKEGASFTSAITLAQRLVAAAPSAAADAADPPAPEQANGAAAGESAAAAAAGENGAAAAEAEEEEDAALLAALSLSAAEAESGGGGGGEASSSGSGGAFSQELVNSYVHMIYGMSKDWCSSGLRVGILYSRNRRLHKSLDSITIFPAVSNHTQWALAQVLDDAEWCDRFLAGTRAQLESSYDLLTKALTAEKIPFTPAVGGMFVWVDLRRWLSEPTWEAEHAFFEMACEKCRVVMTPGHDCHAAEPGFFRICFAWMRPDALPEAVRRLRLMVGGAQAGSDCTVQ